MKKKTIKIASIGLLVIISIYFIAVYSSIPFIEKWRTLYIETAMNTMNHQWLATAFIPSSIINEVMERNQRLQEMSIVEENKIEIIKDISTKAVELLGNKDEFRAKYKEINIETLPEDIDYENLVLLKEDCARIKTMQGDEVYTIDTVNGIVIINICENGFRGKLCIIKDPSRVSLATTSQADRGQLVKDIAAENNAILAINAGGYNDPGEEVYDGTPLGLVISKGQQLSEQLGIKGLTCVGLDQDNNLRIGRKLDTTQLRDAVEFKPALIADGKPLVSGSAGWGIQARAIIAQTSSKEVILLAIDGLRPGHSIGATLGDCIDILLRYGATQALNLDGGTSTALVYDGQTINKPNPNSGNADGREVPNVWIVERKGG